LGQVDGKAANAARRAAAPAGIEAPRRVETEGLGARPADFRRLPGGGGEVLLGAAVPGVLGARAVLVTGLPPPLVLQARLPHEVAGEARDAAALLDEGVDGVAH